MESVCDCCLFVCNMRQVSGNKQAKNRMHKYWQGKQNTSKAAMKQNLQEAVTNRRQQQTLLQQQKQW